MAGIQDFIALATKNLGIDEGQAKNATGGLLDFVKGHVDGGDFKALLGEMPGAADLAGKAKSSSGGGLLGGVAKMAGSALGGKLGAAAGLMGALSGTGLKAGQIDDFVGLFLGFAKKNVSGDLLGRILDRIPELKKLVG